MDKRTGPLACGAATALGDVGPVFSIAPPALLGQVETGGTASNVGTMEPGGGQFTGEGAPSLSRSVESRVRQATRSADAPATSARSITPVKQAGECRG